ncbi:hypothetical protein GCG54_00012856 [Colletotrichum gloeosporioides]|uniref:Uncharacterized protein n=1 Tax=Colletotrichum gloeosporioides TaxID=474922 RepID=A0A8H4FPE9_COLGL|nr:uncharacterized protein GCG54_00012856 [Colletotrichum gloeosporioides]KAF3809570.1 hypothetical protein GCG54_00012856 [Colletotrichum gloeosporioides]
MSAGPSHVQTMENSTISPKDTLFFQEAIALADQTLKISSSGPLCPVTKKTANKLKESSQAGLFPASRKDELYTTEDYRRHVRDDTKDLLEYFADEAKYHDLITELCQIFREHYVLRYMGCHVDGLPVALHKLCGAKSNNHCNPTPPPTEEPSPPPVRPLRPLTPSTDIIKRIAHLFCEDGWVRSNEHGQGHADFLQIIKENTPSGRRQRDFNRYTDKLLRGEYDEMAGHLRRDRNRLKTRLHRAEDASLRSVFSDAINKKEKSLFLVNKYVFNGYDDPFWRVYPTKEAVEMSVFQDYWEQRPRRRTDDEDDPFGIPDMGLGPFSW